MMAAWSPQHTPLCPAQGMPPRPLGRTPMPAKRGCGPKRCPRLQPFLSFFAVAPSKWRTARLTAHGPRPGAAHSLPACAILALPATPTQAEVNIRTDQGTDPYAGIEHVTPETAPQGEDPTFYNAGIILVRCADALPPKPPCRLPPVGQRRRPNVRLATECARVPRSRCATRPMAAECAQG